MYTEVHFADISYKVPQKLIPADFEAVSQQIDLYNNTSDVSLIVVNVEQCKFSRSSIIISVDSNKPPSYIQMYVNVMRCSAVYSQRSALSFEGRN